MSNRLSVLLGTSVVAVLAGVAWYLEPVLGGLRMDQLGVPRAGAVLPSPSFLFLKLLLALLGSYLMTRLLTGGRVVGFIDGARFGAMLGVVSATFAFDSAQAGQPLALILSDGLFMIVVASAMGALLAGGLDRPRGAAK